MRRSAELSGGRMRRPRRPSHRWTPVTVTAMVLALLGLLAPAAAADPVASSTSVSATLAATTYGLFLDAGVTTTAANPTGTVVFSEGATELGRAPVVDHHATLLL